MDTIHERDVPALVDSLEKSNLDKTLATSLVDTCTAMSNLLDTMVNLPTSPPSLYMDLEGIYLSRHGSVSILQVHVSPENRSYLIDIHTLGDQAFSTAGASGQTLKGILESDSIPKVFFDVRNDSDALFSHFGISLSGIHDIQLMELATRTYQRRYVSGLAKCIERDICLSVSERAAWKETKERGLDLFAPERGGSYEVFDTRPLPEAILLYCIQDVHFMPKLWQHYQAKMTVPWATKVQRATRERVALSQTPTYNGKGRHSIVLQIRFEIAVLL